jgi:hypothetical protein
MSEIVDAFVFVLIRSIFLRRAVRTRQIHEGSKPSSHGTSPPLFACPNHWLPVVTEPAIVLADS